MFYPIPQRAEILEVGRDALRLARPQGTGRLDGTPPPWASKKFSYRWKRCRKSL
jgi:hypothetical protein